MATGKITTLFSDKSQSEALFPRTKTSAISDDNGVGLDAIMEHLAYADTENVDVATAPTNVDTFGGRTPEEYALSADVAELEENVLLQLGAKAPAGYGLGEETAKRSTINDMLKNGFYHGTITEPATGYSGNTYGVHVQYNDNYAYQEMVGMKASTGITEGTVRRRYKDNGVWSEIEYENPPMLPGVEYRTTERLNGKPVYCKYIDGGYLPNTGFKIYTIAEYAIVFDVYGPNVTSVNFGASIPPTLQSDNVVSCFTTGDSVVFACGGDRSNIPFFFVAKYTKTTD